MCSGRKQTDFHLGVIEGRDAVDILYKMTWSSKKLCFIDDPITIYKFYAKMSWGVQWAEGYQRLPGRGSLWFVY